jgi:hypothetical protein
LWKREGKRAILYGLISLHCLCNKCKGQFVYALDTIKIHILLNGRDPFHRIWRGPCDKDSLDEEWEENFRKPIQKPTQGLDLGTNMQAMVAYAFQ